MRFSDIFFLSTRMFVARTSRTILTIFGMSIGIGAILFLVSLGFGLQKTLLERITTAEALATLQIIPSVNEKDATVTHDTIARIRALPEVAHVSPVIDGTMQLSIEDLSTTLDAAIIDENFLTLNGISVVSGAGITQGVSDGVVLTTAAARIFDRAPEKIVGTNITAVFSPSENISAEHVTVAATGPLIVRGVVNEEDAVIYASHEAFASSASQNFSRISIGATSAETVETVRGALAEQGFTVSAVSDTVREVNQMFAVLQVILILFGVVALAVSAIGMFNTMTVALLERTSEIGIMKSIGAPDSSIALLFVVEATIMGFLGGVGGVLLGLVGTEVVNGLINIIATRLGGEAVDLFYSPLWFVALIILAGALVGLLTSAVPAYRASNVDPLEALRYK